MPAEAEERWLPGVNGMLLSSKAAYSTDKAAFQCACGEQKHCVLVGVQQVMRAGGAAFACRVCSGKGSAHERVLYECLAKEPLIGCFAVEAHATISNQQLLMRDGSVLQPSLHRWDAVTLVPPNLLIEVHGEQHTSKLDMRSHNRDSSLCARAEKDHKLAAAARTDGFSVLWLHVDGGASERARAQQWAEQLRAAAVHVHAGHPPRLFVG